MNIKVDDLSPFSKKLFDDNQLKLADKNVKLVVYQVSVKNYRLILPLLQFL